MRKQKELSNTNRFRNKALKPVKGRSQSRLLLKGKLKVKKLY